MTETPGVNVRAAPLAAILALVGCAPADEPILGRFEVVGSVRGGVEADGPTTAAPGVTPLTWARESWILEKDRMVVERDVLTPALAAGHVACQVSVKVQAAWSGAVLTIPYGATSRAAAQGTEAIHCEVSVQPGEWRMTKLAGKAWDYEMTSDDLVLRMVMGGKSPDYGNRIGAAAKGSP